MCKFSSVVNIRFLFNYKLNIQMDGFPLILNLTTKFGTDLELTKLANARYCGVIISMGGAFAHLMII